MALSRASKSRRGKTDTPMSSDPIANFITAIKNAGDAGKETVSVPFSQMKFAIAKLLEERGYITSVAKKGKRVRKFIDVNVMYADGAPRVSGVKRISKPSRRVYYAAKDIKPIRYGFGMVVLSTPRGIMSGEDARKARVGGEVLFEIW